MFVEIAAVMSAAYTAYSSSREQRLAYAAKCFHEDDDQYHEYECDFCGRIRADRFTSCEGCGSHEFLRVD